MLATQRCSHPFVTPFDYGRLAIRNSQLANSHRITFSLFLQICIEFPSLLIPSKPYWVSFPLFGFTVPSLILSASSPKEEEREREREDSITENKKKAQIFRVCSLWMQIKIRWVTSKRLDLILGKSFDLFFVCVGNRVSRVFFFGCTPYFNFVGSSTNDIF